MKEKIVITVVAAVAGAVCTFLFGWLGGLFAAKFRETDAALVAKTLVDTPHYLDVVLDKLVERVAREASVVVGTHAQVVTGKKDSRIEIAFDPPFISPPQLHVFVSGFGGPESTPIHDAYVTVHETRTSGASLDCTAAPYEKAWLRFNWIAVGHLLAPGK